MMSDISYDDPKSLSEFMLILLRACRFQNLTRCNPGFGIYISSHNETQEGAKDQLVMVKLSSKLCMTIHEFWPNSLWSYNVQN